MKIPELKTYSEIALENIGTTIALVPMVGLTVLGKTRAEELRFIHEAAARTKLISGFLVEDEHGRNKIYQPVDPVKQRRGVILERIVVSSISLKGHENLRKIRKLQIDGKEITVTPAHRHDLDHTLLREGLDQEGFHDLAEKLFFFAGVKMWRRRHVAFFMPGENALVVRTPGDEREIKKMRSRDVWTPRQQKVIDAYAAIFQNLTDQSRSVVRALKERGQIAVFYPESTRSRDGFLGRVPREVGAILAWGRQNTWGVPVTSDGIRKGWVPGNLPNISSIITRNVPVSIIVGEPYPAQEMWERDFRGLSLNREEATPGDYAAARIAQLNWGLVRTEERQFYRDVLNAPLKSCNRATRIESVVAINE